MDKKYELEGNFYNSVDPRIYRNSLAEKDLRELDKERSKRENFVYQPLKLIKEMEDRKEKNEKNEETGRTYKGLQKAAGLSPIHPKTEFEVSFLKDLFTHGYEQKCKFLICVTMYNEGYQDLENTLTGIIDNIDTFRREKVDTDSIACVVIVDGFNAFCETYNLTPSYFSHFFNFKQVQLNLKTLDTFNPDKIRAKDLMTCRIRKNEDYDEFAHCFMHELKLNETEKKLKLIFCVKEDNKRKLNTHLWFFGGFCEMINPKFVMLLDVGTKPLTNSLYYLYQAMDRDNQIAGCCGEIVPMNTEFWKIVVPAQMVEYKFAHMLDKALESIFGYITVLPGAFSAYRWEVLKGDTLWEDYFKSICRPEAMDLYYSNIYLAEDRVLCLSLVAQKEKNNILRYVRYSKAQTDVPDTISGLMTQRRRWINGSWFALIDTVYNCSKIYKSGHSKCRKIALSVQMFYYILNLIYTWFLVGLFCLAFCITIFKNFEGQANESVATILIVIYIALLLIILITSLSVNPKRIEDFFKALAVVMGIYQVFIIYLILKFTLAMDYSRNSYYIIISMAAAAFFFVFNVLINFEIISVTKGALYYIFLIPTYVNIFSIYSICNLHDCSWGNRPDKMTEEEKKKTEEFQKIRTYILIPWVLSNSAAAYVSYWVYKMDNDVSFWTIAIITVVGIAIILLRGIFGIIYFAKNICDSEKIKSLQNIQSNVDEIELNRKRSYWVFEEEKNPENYLDNKNRSNSINQKKNGIQIINRYK